jgi:hypothetical protein
MEEQYIKQEFYFAVTNYENQYDITQKFNHIFLECKNHGGHFGVDSILIDDQGASAKVVQVDINFYHKAIIVYIEYDE